MQPIAERYKGRFEVFVVTAGTKGDLDYLGQVPALRVLLDPDGGAFAAYGVTGIPDTFVVSPKGLILENIVGWQGDVSAAEFADTVRRVAGP